MTEQISATVEMASTEKEAIKKLRALSECCICLMSYKDPRLLPCFHSACLKCFEDIQLTNEKKPGDVLPCPLCRNEFPIPADGMKGLQRNFFIENLMEVTSTFNLETNPSPCTTCSMIEDANNVTEASMRCLNCSENYCLRCSKIHKTLKATKDHKIVELKIEVNEEEIRNMFPIRKCVRHSDRVLDFYCSDCKTVVCVSCFVEDHQTHKCKDVTTVDMEFRQRIEQSFTSMYGHKEKILSRKFELETKKGDLLPKVLKIESAIRTKNQELKDLIDQHTEELLNELSLLKQQQKKTLEAEIEEIERKLAILESFVTYCTELKSKGSPSAVCGSADRLLTRANELSKENEEYLKAPHKLFELEFTATDHNALLQIKDNVIGKLSDDSRSEATFHYTVQNVSKLKDSSTSAACYVRNLPWKIMVMPRKRKNMTEKNFGFFLQCNGESDSVTWSCSAFAELRILNQKLDKKPLCREFQHTFNSKENDWGFSNFIAMSELLDPVNGYIKDDTVTVEVYMKADAPHGVR